LTFKQHGGRIGKAVKAGHVPLRGVGNKKDVFLDNTAGRRITATGRDGKRGLRRELNFLGPDGPTFSHRQSFEEESSSAKLREFIRAFCVRIVLESGGPLWGRVKEAQVAREVRVVVLAVLGSAFSSQVDGGLVAS